MRRWDFGRFATSACLRHDSVPFFQYHSPGSSYRSRKENPSSAAIQRPLPGCCLMKARSHVRELEDMPNVGPSLAADLRIVGVSAPSQLIGSDPYRLYDKLCLATGARQDPCVLDTFISAVRF